jgi:MscS family membrane protein
MPALSIQPSRTIRYALVFFILLSTAFTVASAASNEPPAGDGNASETVQQAKPVEPIRPLNTEGIDKAGEKIANSIDEMGNTASRYLGDWVNRKTIADISWIKLLFCVVLLLAVMVVERVLRILILHRIQSIPSIEGVISWMRLLLQALVKPLSLAVYVYGIYAAVSPLFSHFATSDGTNLVLEVAKRSADIGGTVALFWFLYRLVSLLDARLIKWADATESTIDNMLAPLVGKTLRVFIVIVGGMMVLQNLTGVQIGPLIASLGIGGLAVALAAKDSIANFFGTLTILFDKPFQVGERIVIDNHDGTVENVGFRSTRIRLLTGHLVTIPNEKIVNSAVENIGRRPNIRWLNNIGITYDTPPEKVSEAVEILRSILENHEGMHPDFPPRVYFNGFNDWSLNILVVAWYHPPDYWDFQTWVQATCLEIMRRFEAADIDFAFPSQTLYLANEDKRQLKLKLIDSSRQA